MEQFSRPVDLAGYDHLEASNAVVLQQVSAASNDAGIIWLSGPPDTVTIAGYQVPMLRCRLDHDVGLRCRETCHIVIVDLLSRAGDPAIGGYLCEPSSRCNVVHGTSVGGDLVTD